MVVERIIHFKMKTNFVEEYFSKYRGSGKRNYRQLSRYLSKLTQKKCEGVITVGEYQIPNYVPDDKLSGFADLLLERDGWTKLEADEMRFVCRGYLGVQFRNDQECLAMLEALNQIRKDPRYESLIDYFTVDEVDLDTDAIISLMEDGENPINPLIASYILTTEVDSYNPF